MPDCHDELFQFEHEKKATEMKNYVGGYICRKLKLQSSEQVPNSWVYLKGQGRLLQPDEAIQDVLSKCDKIFSAFNGTSPFSLRKCKDPLGKVQNLITKKLVDPKIIRLYCKVKFYARLKLINEKLKTSQGRNVRYLKELFYEILKVFE